jgi:hypothetical protein
VTYFVLLSGLAYFRIWLILEFGLFSRLAYFRVRLIFGFSVWLISKFGIFAVCLLLDRDACRYIFLSLDHFSRVA